MPSDCFDSEHLAQVFTRTIDLLQPAGFQRLQRAFVAVLGLGGVGSHTAVALARAGVGRLLLVDADEMTLSSLNRHAVASLPDVGKPKAAVVEKFLRGLRPDMGLKASQTFVDASTVDELLEPRPDLVVDAIDSLSCKVIVLAHCLHRGITVISSMGASSRLDSSLIRVGDLAETSMCPLARQVRKRLRRLGIDRGITCVYSTEPPLPPLSPDEDEHLRRGRVRNRQPSLSTLPGIFGYTLANVAILQLAGPVSPPANELTRAQ